MKYRPHDTTIRVIHASGIAHLVITAFVAGCGAYDAHEEGAGGAPSTAREIGGDDGTANESGLRDAILGSIDASGEAALAPAPSNAIACTMHSQCATGHCYDGVCCDVACNDKCMACTAVKKGSGVDGVCGPIKYDTDPDNECPSGGCDGKYVCKKYNGVPCTSTAQCLSNYCVDGVCCGNICMGACQACTAAKKGGGYDGACGNIAANTDPDNECSGGECTGAGACNTAQTKLSNGAACISAAQCLSGYCADGVCCDSWCVGTCQACTAAKKGSGSDGTCGMIKYDTDPDEECWGGSCNGKGACRQYNGTWCSSNTQCLSNYCVDGYCCGNVCAGSCYACSAVKKGQGTDGSCGPIATGKDPDNECSPGECNGAGSCNAAQTPQAIGAACTNNGQCSSGFCADGVCCDNACNGSCVACIASKKGSGTNGTCGPIKYDTDPDDECWGGGCDGKGACRQYNAVACSANWECLSGYCVDGYCCNNLCAGMCQACNAAYSIGSCKTQCPAPCTTTLGLPNAPFVPTYVLGKGTHAVTSTDLDGDGKLDLVVPRISEATAFSVLLNQGNGAFGSAVEYAVGGTSTSLLPMADLNGDGKLDFVAFDNAADTFAAVLNQGNGTFAAKIDYATGDNPAAVKTVDVNGDGKLDVLTMNTTADTVSVLMNQGNGTFAAKVDYPTGDCAATFVTPDLNGDGNPDIAMVCGSVVAVLLNQGNGTFAPHVDITTGNGAVALVDVDVNGDGMIDIVTGHYPSNWQVGVLLNQGNGVLASAMLYPIGYYSNVLDTVDLNGDGAVDILARYQDKFSILLNQGGGTYGSAVNYTLAAWPAVTRLVDLNGDQRPDFIAMYGGTVGVRLNQGNGTLGTQTDYSTNYQLLAVDVRDVDGDNRPEIIASGTSGMAVLHNLGNGSFQISDNYAVPDQISAFAVADVVGTNQPEIAVGFSAGLNVRTHLGAGVFSKEGMGGAVVVPIPRQPMFVAVGDFNADGKRDIATKNVVENGVGTVTVLLNQGNGVMGAPTETAATNWPTYVNAAADANRNGYIDAGEQWQELWTIWADFSGDGRLDYVTYSYEPGFYGWGPLETIDDVHKILIYFGNANGTFSLVASPTVATNPPWPIGTAYQGYPPLASADFDGNGKPDLAIAVQYTAWVWLNQGNGVFDWSAGWSNGPPTAIAAADMNGDAKADVVVQWGTDTRVYLGQGNGTFGAQPIQVTSNHALERLVDLTGDGRAEIIATDSHVSVMRNNGDGTMGSNALYGIGTSGLMSIAAGDLDDDDRYDIVTANGVSRTVSILLNRCLP